MREKQPADHLVDLQAEKHLADQHTEEHLADQQTTEHLADQHTAEHLADQQTAEHLALVRHLAEERAAQLSTAHKLVEERAAYWKAVSESQIDALSKASVEKGLDVNVRPITEDAQVMWKSSLTAPSGDLLTSKSAADDKSDLWRMMESSQYTQIGGESGEKIYACTMCEKSYSYMAGLRRHLRMTHSGERPYKCDVCAMGFTQSTDLKRHFRIHTGEKPYKCSTCGKAFTQSGTLTVHMRTHIL